MMIFLASCHSSTLSFSKIDHPPNDIQDKIDLNLTLQALTNEKGTTYIVFHSNRDVEANLEVEGNKLKIIFKEKSRQHGPSIPHIYKLTKDHNYDEIEVIINGQSTPFDAITVY